MPDSLIHTHTTGEVAASLRVSDWWVREQCKPIRDEEGRVVRPALVSPIRVGRRLRFTSGDVEALHAALRPAPAVSPRRRRRRARVT